jgi:hypothetical protein
MLYYYIGEIANVNAVFCDADNGDSDGGGGGGGDHQNDGYDNDALFSMTFPNDPSFPMAPLSQWVRSACLARRQPVLSTVTNNKFRTRIMVLVESA